MDQIETRPLIMDVPFFFRGWRFDSRFCTENEKFEKQGEKYI